MIKTNTQYKKHILSVVNLNTPRVINLHKTLEYPKRPKDITRIMLTKLSQTTMETTEANKTNMVSGTYHKTKPLLYHTSIHLCGGAEHHYKIGRKNMDNTKPADKPKPINESIGNMFDAKMADIKMAIAFGIVFGIGIASGWYLTVTHFFG